MARVIVTVRNACILTISGLGLLLQWGCAKQDEITQYRVPKPHVLKSTNSADSQPESTSRNQPNARKKRMLAAIVPWENQAWFFKLTGPDEPVAQQAEAFKSFITSIRFTGPQASKPQWDLPAGWRQRAGTGMRYATLEVGSAEEPLELTVIALPAEDPASAEYALANVNRWRGQLGLPSITKDQLANESQKIPLTGTQARVVNFVGRPKSSPTAMPPFASGGGRPAFGPSGSAGGRDAVKLTFDKPDDWKETTNNQFSRHAFVAEDGGKTVRITVTPFGVSAASLAAQVNRWRRQVELPPKNEQELEQDLQEIKVGRRTAHYVELVGPRESILGVIAEAAGKTWFFKLHGDRKVAAQQKRNFENFVRSVNFGRSEGSGNGR